MKNRLISLLKETVLRPSIDQRNIDITLMEMLHPRDRGFGDLRGFLLKSFELMDGRRDGGVFELNRVHKKIGFFRGYRFPATFLLS